VIYLFNGTEELFKITGVTYIIRWLKGGTMSKMVFRKNVLLINSSIPYIHCVAKKLYHQTSNDNFRLVV